MPVNCRKSITFGDAVKSSRPTAFSTMVKPVGSSCNLDCTYCYYLDKSDIYGNGRPKMDYALLEEYTRQYLEANDVPVVTFAWHGGEPLLAGVEFYRKAMEFQQKYGSGKRIENTLQTNGLLVDNEWCDFFRDNNFLIGVSIDGPTDIHDRFRLDKGARPTFDKVRRAIEMMASSGVEYNTLTTVSRAGEGRGRDVYRFLKSIGSRFMQFLPVLEYVADAPEGSRACVVPPGTECARPAEWSVTAEGFGNFMNDIFDDWVLSDVGKYYVQLFDVALAQWVGAPPGLCSFGETCGEALVVEYNGDVYSCDHFVYPQHRIGNIKDGNMPDMLKSPAQFKFGIDKRNNLPSECLRCKWHFACRGECPKHRFDTAANGEKNLNALCKGYKLFFSHVDPYINFMAGQLSDNLPPANVMLWARRRMGFHI